MIVAGLLREVPVPHLRPQSLLSTPRSLCENVATTDLVRSLVKDFEAAENYRGISMPRQDD